ncbi:MAG: hypothetical protein MUO85_04030, partial [candidate division Zixibacteria bacterium]|nr:hypothetical protein [candidate division Zixibacteria bacterium]
LAFWVVREIYYIKSLSLSGDFVNTYISQINNKTIIATTIRTNELSFPFDSSKNLSGMITLCHKCHYNREEHGWKKKCKLKKKC